ncbi:MAG: hypothetical protein L0154_02860 [Chloroflexi bacterium]|nr:hypothetical protein [Chloroflexota bacterium]
MNREKWQEVISVVIGGTTQLGFRGIQEPLQKAEVPGNWFFLWIALEVEPDPVSAASLAIQNPYGSLQNPQNQLSQLAEGGYLDVVGDHQYRLSAKGREKLLYGIDVLNDNVAKLSLLDEAKIARIDTLLGKFVNNALNEERVAHPNSLKRNHTSYPGDGVAPIVRIFHYLTDVGAYADDAHMETWRWNNDGVDGPTWETLSLLWKDGLNTAAQVQERLPNRGHSVEVYENAFKKLVKLGWVSGEHTITEEGQKVRDEAEAQTKDNYFAPLEKMGDEADELLGLLIELKAAIEGQQAFNKKQDIWKAANSCIATFAPHYMYKTIPVLQEHNIMGQQFSFLSHSLGEEIFSAEHMEHAQPFNNVQHLRERMDEFVEMGFFEKANGGYLRTTAGDTAIRAFYRAAHEALADYHPMPEDELKTVTHLLKRVVNAAENLDYPADKTNLGHSRVTDPGDGGAYMALIDQYVTDLNFYRDDAHNATWRALDVTAVEWDALTQVKNGTASTPEAVNGALTRNHTLEDYQQAFANLVERGWLKKVDGEYKVTAEGKAIRDQAEIDTDANFFAPFDTLSSEELDQVQTLLQKLEKETKLAGYQETYRLSQEVSAAYGKLYQPKVTELVAEIGYQDFDWFYSYMAGGIDPEPFTIEATYKITPYARQEDRFYVRSDAATERGFLRKVDDGAYRVTDKGREGVAKFFTEAYAYLTGFELLDEATMQNTVAILKKIVDGIEASDTGKFFFDISRTSHQHASNDAAAIDQYVTDLGRFRDGAHIAAWQSSGLTANQLETLSFVWGGEFTTAEAIHKQRPNRGYSVEEFQQTLDTLVEKGLIEADGSGYKVTAAGKTLRDGIEDKTNDLFFASWAALTGGEVGRLRLQLMRLKDRIEAVTPQPEQA